MLARTGDVEVGKIEGVARTLYVSCSIGRRIYLIIQLCFVYIMCKYNSNYDHVVFFDSLLVDEVGCWLEEEMGRPAESVNLVR